MKQKKLWVIRIGIVSCWKISCSEIEHFCMRVFKELVDLALLFSDYRIQSPGVHVLLILEEIQDFKQGLLLGLWFLELDDCLLRVDSVQHGQVFLRDLEKRVMPAVQQKGRPARSHFVKVVAGVREGGPARLLVGADGLD
jgi:hypothetical protein